ncbi:Predicted kinase, aminoglycoside phosphotransferase (APT) family [Paenibacillus sp. UNC496MF]|uniref:phosphotransferase enzyme family protein n=1 Tax=Paenibacillus sp. UNC496MF TaxID=1502753 RepID=UPI0008E0CE7D|nr:phosphotransferase [Paenibacillus sp. UNC496MF]SFJ69326.1 Predicted kinase, aminoglycoside phosphotransferase (APT) family [Paenibacillus sp. UNC496MF]
MSENENERLAQEIAGELKRRFGLTAQEAVTIDKGWLNVKWRMTTDRGPLFVKYYHPERYKLHANPERRKGIERNLRLQHGLSVAGIPCPGVYVHEGQCLQETPSGLHFAALDWVEGQTAEAGCMNAAQLSALGAAVGRMHRRLNAGAPAAVPVWTPDKAAYRREWQRNWDAAEAAGDGTVLSWLERSRTIVDALDFGLFAPSRTGWLHWDLWVDNLVLHARGVAGIVDFDRMDVAYPEIDVARALLSGTLRDGRIREEEARAFLDGYRAHAEAPRGMLSRAMRLLYVIESGWWLRTEVRRDGELRGLLARFVEEMHWLEANWDTLADQLDPL